MKKKKFILSVQEILNRLVCVEAESYDEAFDLVRNAWYNNDIVLDADDYVEGGTEIFLYEDNPTEEDLKICKNFIRYDG